MIYDELPIVICFTYIVGTVDPGTCIDTFDQVLNKGSGNASPNTAARTVAACKTACLQMTACLGFDWNKAPTTSTDTLCYIHTVAADFAASSTRTTVDQYTRVECQGLYHK